MLALLGLLIGGMPSSLQLVLPIRCERAADCPVQKLPDHAPGPARQDFACGTLTTDGHDGVDFRVVSDDRFRAGVPILAAAAGRVVRTRDGEPDLSIRERGGTGGKDAGNGVVIDHGGGWETQYSHARQGSIAVRPGDAVTAGQPIAMVGLSGNTEYPHLHFAVRRDGVTFDPFTGAPITAPCGGVARAAMWRPPVPYRPTVLARIGFASGVRDPAAPAFADLDLAIDPHRPLLVWVDLIGAQPGDEQRFTIVGPGGTIVDSHKVVGRGGLIWFGFVGRRAPPGGWPRGLYRGRFELRRGGRDVLTAETETRVDAGQLADPAPGAP